MQATAADYSIVPVLETRQAKVTVDLGDSGTSNEFRLPAWAPGDYQILDFGKNVASITFYKAGEEVPSTQGDDRNLWTIPDGADKVVYFIKESLGNFGAKLRVTPDEMFVSGAGVFGWFKGHMNEQQVLHLSPEGMPVAIALPSLPDHPNDYVAKDYDQLADSPFAVSRNLKVKAFMAGGKQHYVAAFNDPGDVDLDAYASVCTKAVESTKAIFGELPYKEYWFLFDFGGPGGGLEHSNCCKIGLHTGTSAEEARGIIFHEYFHCFNVKRIRPAVLGPFDYTKPAVTGALWWLEGVTDYYAEILQVRSGLISRSTFLTTMTRIFNGFHRGTAYTRVTANESSTRVWEAPRSQGYGFSYYTKGKLIGMALDLAIRANSRNTRSLDDVIRELYRETLDKPGFAEGRIRDLCVEYGGPETGRVYDVCVNQAVRIPLEAMLDPVGMGMPNGAIVDLPNAPQTASDLGSKYPYPVGNRYASSNTTTPRREVPSSMSWYASLIWSSE